MNNSDIKEIMYKEIDLIQSCITRMAQNSFMVKGWLIALLSVILALLPEKVNVKVLCILGFVVVICFWYLDAFFLKTERLYRWKYDWVIKNRITSNEFIFDLNPYNSKMWLKKKSKNGELRIPSEPGIIRIMVTKTLLVLYIPLIIAIIFTFINQYTNWI